ncbi:hypothetical protein CCP4SC76_5180024 [Gammaproteobacteria bacterium]
MVRQTKRLYLEDRCTCGHWTRAEPGRADAEEDWKVELTEWHLAGPMLVAPIYGLALRMRLSRARIQGFLRDCLGLELGMAVINQYIHEAGRAVDPVVQEEIVGVVCEAGLLHADETSWTKCSKLVWLWFFSCATATLFAVSRRVAEVVRGILDKDFKGWLMSDGYVVYREFLERLCCWVHIIRKTRGSTKSLDRGARGFGEQVLKTFEILVDAVYEARGSPPTAPLREQYSIALRDLLDACRRQASSSHERTAMLARELINDWGTFWVA